MIPHLRRPPSPTPSRILHKPRQLHPLAVGLRCVQGATLRTILMLRTRTVFCRTLTSLYDEKKLGISYLQVKFTKVSTECVKNNDYGRGL